MSSRTPDPGVVVGVNGSGNSLRAVRWAAAEAHRRGVPLRIVHATPSALGIPLDEQRAASILALAHAVATHAQPRVPTHTECVHERPARALTAAAETARLLVVGMGSGRGCDGVLVRSLALDVCAAASCPVVVVRGAAGPMSTDGPVVLGLDDVGRDVCAITAAFADAEGPARRLVVVHALRGPDAMVDAMAGHPASARAAAQEEITTALAPWRSRHPSVPVEVRVVHGAPADRRRRGGCWSSARTPVGRRPGWSSTPPAAPSYGAAPVRSWSYLGTRACSIRSCRWSTPPSPAPESWGLRPHGRGEPW